MISMKKITLAIVLILLASFVFTGCSKEAILDQYNNIIQTAGNVVLTSEKELAGKKEKGIDNYTGTYQAEYKGFSKTEYLFGGTSINREAGKELMINCSLEVKEGTAKVFWSSGADEPVTLIETTGSYNNTITLPVGGNYIGIVGDKFIGSIDLKIQ